MVLAVFLLGVLLSGISQCSSIPVQAENTCKKEMYYLGGQGLQAVFSCTSPDSDGILSIDAWKLNGNMISIDESKYSASSSRLYVNDIESSDEGSYSCVATTDRRGEKEFNISCLYVVGKAVFSTCSDESPERNSCSDVEEITVTVGNGIRLDTRVAYVNSGASRRNQTTQILQLSKEGVSNLYICFDIQDHMGVPCSSRDRFQVVQGSHKFDVELVLENAVLADSGMYTAKVEALNPSTGATTVFRKQFLVNVKVPPVELSIDVTGVPFAGSVHSLTCAYSPTHSTAKLRWLDSSGNVLNSSKSQNVDLLDNGSLRLMFTSLSPEQTGNYTCQATVAWSAHNVSITKSISEYINVIEITGVSATPVSGSKVRVSWRPGTLLYTTVHYYTVYAMAFSGGSLWNVHSVKIPGDVTSTLVTLDDIKVHLTYRFQVSVSVLGEDGYYMESQRTLVTSATTVSYDEETIEISVGPVEECTSWNLNFKKAELVADAVRQGIASHLTYAFNSSFPMENIRKGRLMCGSNSTIVTYKSIVVGDGEVTATMLSNALTDWTKMPSGAVISIGAFMFNLQP